MEYDIRKVITEQTARANQLASMATAIHIAMGDDSEDALVFLDATCLLEELLYDLAEQMQLLEEKVYKNANQGVAV